MCLLLLVELGAVLDIELSEEVPPADFLVLQLGLQGLQDLEDVVVPP